MRSTIARVCLLGLGLALMVCSMEGIALASVPVAPEIDGATLGAGLAAVTSAALILKSRRRTK